MAHHQHALVRYVTLDRCLSRLRLTKEELIDRCSEAVSLVTGDRRSISEKTFYNDIRALREGIVLSREAPIVCVQGRYQYGEQGFLLFHAGAEARELKALHERLEQLEDRARRALARIEDCGRDAKLVAEVRAILLDEEVCTWVHFADKEEEAGGRIEHLKDVEQAKANARREAGPIDPPEPNKPLIFEQRAGPEPPADFSADDLVRWYLEGQWSWQFARRPGRMEGLKRRLFRSRAVRLSKRMAR
jgi:hypothetical protein